MDNGTSVSAQQQNYAHEQVALSALFRRRQAAEAAVRELREVDIPAEAISLISRDEDYTGEPAAGGAAGVAHEDVGQEALTYRASEELPNDEDLPTTEAQMTGRQMPIVTDYEVPPDEPLGGSERLGLSRDSDMVRTNDAETNADEDIYTDFPDRPGGINPEFSAAASRAGADVQEPLRNRTDGVHSAAVGAGLGSLAGLLVGMAGLAIPGIGPFIAAGPLAGALGGLVAGGAAGGIIGALSTIGVPEEYAREYAARIEQGDTLVSVRTLPINEDLVERVLAGNGGESVH